MRSLLTQAYGRLYSFATINTCFNLPIYDRVVVGVEKGAIRDGFAYLCHEFVFIDCYAQSGLGRQRTIAPSDRRQRRGEEVLVFIVAVLLGKKVRDCPSNLQARGE